MRKTFEVLLRLAIVALGLLIAALILDSSGFSTAGELVGAPAPLFLIAIVISAVAWPALFLIVGLLVRLIDANNVRGRRAEERKRLPGSDTVVRDTFHFKFGFDD